MGVYYTVYAEARFRDEWVDINSYALCISGEYALCPIISGQSFLGEALDRFENLPSTINWNDLSEGVKKHIADDYSEEHRASLINEPFTIYDYVQSTEQNMKRANQYEYYVYRESIAAFENGELDEIMDWLTFEEYSALSQSKRSRYAFYKWNTPWDTFETIAQIKSRVDDCIYRFNYHCIPYEYPRTDNQTEITPRDVRLVVEISI
jgi:hypothetical protein